MTFSNLQEHERLCILNYGSKLGVDNQHSYDFWFASYIFRIVAKDPFARGDLAKIISYTVKNESESILEVEIIDDPKWKLASSKSIKIIEDNEVPRLVACTSKIPLSHKSDYSLTKVDGIDPLLFISSEKSLNKAYTLIGLVTHTNAKATCKCDVTKSEFDFIVVEQ